MPEQEAITNMQSILQRKGIEGISPIAREVKCAAVPTQKNVVLIFMESMSANLMEHFGSTKTDSFPRSAFIWNLSVLTIFIQRAYIPTTECMPPSTLSLPS